MSSTLSFNPPIKAAEILPPDPEADGDAPKRLGATIALIGLVIDLESGAGQAIVVNPDGQIEWRDPTSIELFIAF